MSNVASLFLTLFICVGLAEEEWTGAQRNAGEAPGCCHADGLAEPRGAGVGGGGVRVRDQQQLSDV